MSTRRARIKAVAALPPRRKNAVASDGARSSSITSKEAAEKSLKSPKSPRTIINKNDQSPGSNRARTPVIESFASPKLPTNEESSRNSPKVCEKVPYVTNIVYASKRSTTEIRNAKSVCSLKSPVVHSVNISSTDDNIGFSRNQTDVIDGASSSRNEYIIPELTDFNIPSVPESITEEMFMDSITPIKRPPNTAKRLEQLKNEILSGYAEVAFDPIIPLPSPTKVRPKLRPVPRLGPHRRNSIQGSASESEDESRRALLASAPTPPRQRHDSHTSHHTQQSQHSILHRELSRARTESLSSVVSQPAPPVVGSPVKEKQINKARRTEMGKRLWRRRRDTVKRDALTMYDLIFYNPTTNPIIPDQEELKAKEENAKDEAERAKTQQSEEEDDPPEEDSATPVPQIKLGPNGEIMLDEKSLVIKQSDGNRKVSSVVREGAWANANGGRYTRTARTAEWSHAETVRFYRALAAVGTDFSLMAQLFPDRNRRDLKIKFKKEERVNVGQIDKALRSATTFDVSSLQTEFHRERQDAAARAERAHRDIVEGKRRERERARQGRTRSKGAKALESAASEDAACKELTGADLIQRATESTTRRKRYVSTTQHVEPKSNTTMAIVNKKPVPDLIPIANEDKPPVPKNIEAGSLVVIRVSDSKSPSKTMLQTYIARGPDQLIPVALSSTFLNSVVGYMKDTPKGTVSTASSPLLSPNSISVDRSSTPGVIQLNPSPGKRQRHSSYSITSL